MEIKFKGTLTEFQALFQGRGVPTFQPSGMEDLVSADDIKFEHSPPLAEIPPSLDESTLPFPQNDPLVVAGKVSLPKISDETRKAAWAHFVNFCAEWVKGFGDDNASQPDRLALMTDLGQGRWPIPILVMGYEIGSLQRLVEKALLEANPGNTFDLDWVNLVAANMVQVSHMGFPDVQGLLDYSEKWRRS